MWSAIVSIVMAVIAWFTGRKQSVAEQLGMEEAANAQLRAGQDAIRRADDAAKKVERNPPNDDPNDLDARR